ncbi:uncharacterized protein LOC104582738 [Brachypodium distachyon]|nr:uncharacterized protein LOC104582738 [Brachypodium distachyon]|eukprot:XP_024315035.1 uncharacterized protein LOC104582738 [Brachypodium distachyon]
MEAVAGGAGDVVRVEAPVKMPAEHLVRPVLPQGGQEAPNVDHVVAGKIDLEGQNMGVSEKSGGIMGNTNDEMYDSLRLIQEERDDLLFKQQILEEFTAECDMAIQKILIEGKMTPDVISIIDKYKNMLELANSSFSGYGDQILTTERLRIRIRVALPLNSRCQELDEICRDNNWILPRYVVLPSVEDGMFQASVRMVGLDFDMRIDGDRCMTPREARGSAAAYMIHEIQKKGGRREDRGREGRICKVA